MKKIPVFILAMAALLSAVLISYLLANRAQAMGDNPSSCVNLYDSTIRSLHITVGSKTIEASAKDNTNFVAPIESGYSVTLTVHSASVSKAGDTNTGSIWYGSRAYGFASDQCISEVKADSDITVTLDNVVSSTAKRGTLQNVEWYTWPLDGPIVTYRVHWK
jgi:hypothetical protein